MLKTLLVVFSLGFCWAKVPLRDPEHWFVGHSFDLLNEYMGGFNFGVDQLQNDDYLTELAQAVADLDGNPHNFINSYAKPDGLNVLVFGIKLNGSTNYHDILTDNFNSVMDGMPGYLNFRYKNNTMNVELRQLKRLMDITRCDTMTVPLKCDEDAVKNLWRTGTGIFKFQNENYNYKVKFNNMLRVFESMADPRTDRYRLDIFKDTVYTNTFKNENYEMTFDVPDLFGKGFWSTEESGVWGVGDQIVTILTHGGNIRATSEVEHQFLKVNLWINEPFVAPKKPTKRLNDQELRDEFESHFKTMYEMFDREQVFKSFDKFGQAYSLDSNGNINIIFALSFPSREDVPVLPRERRLSLFNRLKQWPWFAPPQQSYVTNPLGKSSLVDIWRRAMDLSIVPINQDRKADGLPSLNKNQALNTLAQEAAEKMAGDGKFTSPNFSGAQNAKVLVVAMRLDSSTKINEYSFVLNDNNFGQVTCFDNFSNLQHRVAKLIDNERYICSKNSRNKVALETWKKYDSFGTGHAITPNGDAFMAIALSDTAAKIEL
ncbi:hypothetical protein BpHYR1_001166 [Brachionus plicatilis]|uniref:Uncharacterized protein n=1 Tax=Brachionus plicatilis TaxID=10195 RepID=A0A3M7RJ34_BRAPC|nr:hypothetical protein BpHYR1_001166 [Brachionus plicatilis]